MSWKIHDEFIDSEQGRHVVIFKNADTGAEHHLIHHFHMDACPHCGRPNEKHETEPIDFHKVKADTLQSLQDHHRKVAAYREKHPQVRLGAAPKK